MARGAVIVPLPSRERVGGRGLFALAALLLLSGCGGSENPVAGPDKPLTSVGISVSSLRSPYYAAIAKGAETEARLLYPTVQVTTAGDEFSALKQAAQIDAFAAQHTDLLLVVPADPRVIGEAVARARQAGVTVVAVDAPAAGADTLVETDNIEAGAIACHALADGLHNRGQVIILGGRPEPASAARALGCAATLARLPDIHVIAMDANGQGTREGAQRAMRDLFGANTQIDGVFAINDAEALGAADAAELVGRTILITAPQGSPAMETALANRARPNVIATAAIDPYLMGRNAVLAGQDVRNGRAPPSEERLLDPALVTRETVHDYKGWLAARE